MSHSPRRILHVAECYEGGVGRAIDVIAGLLPQYEHFLLYWGSQKPSEDVFAGISHFDRAQLKRVFNVRDAVQRWHVDVVHAHSSWAGVYSRVLPLTVPVIYEPHCYAMEMTQGLPRAVYTVAERILSTRSAATLVLSPREEQIAQRVAPSNDLVFLPNVPTVEIREDRQAVDAGRLGPVFVTVGRVSPQKDPEMLARIVIQARAVLPKARFVWVGGGDYQPGLDALDRAGVEVTGWLELPELQQLLDSATAYVHTARYEGFPLSVLDAAARRAPIICRDIAAFQGTSLVTFDEETSAIDLLQRLTTDEVFRAEVVSKGDLLLRKMNPDAQRAALELAYSLWRGVRGGEREHG